MSGHFLEFDFHIWRTGGAAGGRTWRMNPAVQRSVLLFTAPPHGVGPHHQKLWNLLVFPSWRLRLLRVWLLFFILRYLCSSSFTSVTCLCRQHVHSLSVNPLDIHRLYSHMDSLRNFIRRLKGKVQKMSRTTWLRLQVWKQRQWCLVKVLYFHTWTQINLQFSLILYTLY